MNIIFDWSGVVKDAVVAQLWLINKVFDRHGIPNISMEEFKDNWEQPYQLFYNKYLPDIDIEQEQKDYLEAILSPECPKAEACAGVPELIRALKEKGNFMAVVSSDFPETLDKEIKEYGLENIFTEVISRVHDKTESVENLIKKYNLDLSTTYFVGDSNHEAEIAKRLGIKSVAVTWGLCSEKVLKVVEPDFLVRNVKELKEILSR